VDESRRAIIYDETLADAAARLLRLKAAWQEKALSKISKRTIVFLDEPAMASYGSSYFNISKERVTGLLNEVFGGIRGVKGVHCCGNTDWSIILETGTDVLSFDTYNFAKSLTIYPGAVKDFIARKGAIAWGIVPSEEKPLAGETAATLKDRLEETAIAPLTRQGIDHKKLLTRSLITPSCGLAMLSEDAAEQALKLTAELSEKMRKSYL
jgi:methionine synthase II (cobalamin-independent)